MAFLSGCVLAFVRHPIFGTMTYIATLFLSPQQRWWGQGMLEPVRWAVISAAVAILALIANRKRLAPTAPVFSHGIVALLIVLVIWMGIQSFWAMDKVEHADLLSYYIKFIVALVLVYKSVDSEQSLRLFLWTYVLCGFYFGWIAFTSYDGGRFESFGGAGLGEANAGALAIVTGLFAGAALFLAGNLRERVVLFLIMPFLMNGLVTTISRSGFLALAVGGLVFNYFTPKKFRKPVRLLSVLAVVLFLVVAGPAYWQRMQSLKHAGENVEGMDTGGGRLEIIEAQFRMFEDHPLGCGAMCTAVLSPNYMEASLLTTYGNSMVRASHNTYMSFLVEQGIVGAALFLAMLVWTIRRILALAKLLKTEEGFLPTVLPALAALLAAIAVGDMFVSYTKFEPRIWFIAVLMAFTGLAHAFVSKAAQAPGAPQGAVAARPPPAPKPVRGARGGVSQPRPSNLRRMR
jgi:O-antigen ligase